MGRRWARWTLGMCGAVGLFACAEGSPSQPVQHIDPPAPMMEPLCGNGRIDAMEDCECPNKATTGACPVDNNKTCKDLGMGTGALLCNATLCTYNFTMCTAPKPAAGSGSAGTGMR